MAGGGGGSGGRGDGGDATAQASTTTEQPETRPPPFHFIIYGLVNAYIWRHHRITDIFEGSTYISGNDDTEPNRQDNRETDINIRYENFVFVFHCINLV